MMINPVSQLGGKLTQLVIRQIPKMHHRIYIDQISTLDVPNVLKDRGDINRLFPKLQAS